MNKQNQIFSRDIDHLVSVNKNGLWIRENLDEDTRVITAEKTKIKISNIQDLYLG